MPKKKISQYIQEAREEVDKNDDYENKVDW